jgi:hypothetical protein
MQLMFMGSLETGTKERRPKKQTGGRLEKATQEAFSIFNRSSIQANSHYRKISLAKGGRIRESRQRGQVQMVQT